jgi:hypothetical protein
MKCCHMPFLCDFAQVSFLYISSGSSCVCRCSQLSRSSAWQAEKPALQSTNHPYPSPLLHLGRAGRRVGSIIYGLRPLWCGDRGKSIDIFRVMPLNTHRKKKAREFPVPCRDVTTKLSLGGNSDVITELFLRRGSLVSDIPAGDGKLVNLFLRCILEYFSRTQ